MIRALLCGVAAMALATTAPALAQQSPQPGGNAKAAGGAGAMTLQQAMQAEQQRRAQQEAQAKAQLERDLARMTPQARQQYLDYAQQRLQQAVNGVPLNRLRTTLLGDLERNLGNAEMVLYGNDAFIEGSTRVMSNAQFGQEAARGTVQMLGVMLQLNLDALRSSRDLILQLSAAYADILEERQRLLLLSNPAMPTRERDLLRYQTTSGINAMRNMGRRLDEDEYRLREQQRVISEAEPRIAAALEEAARQQGQNIRNWNPDQFVRPPSAPRSDIGPRTMPASQPGEGPEVAPWDMANTSPEPAATAPTPAPAPAARRPVRRGEIPPADPYADFRIPQELGGSGPARAQQTAQQAAQQATQQPPPPQQLTPEQRALRTEWLRQQAMQRARERNAELDRIWRGEAASNERIDEFEFGDRNSRMIPLQIRPIGGGAGGSGGAGLGQQMAGGGMLAEDFFGSEEWEVAGGCCRVSPEDAFRFGDAAAAAAGMIPVAQRDTWQSFELGGIITVADLIPIYDGYDWWNAPVGSSGRSLSSAGTSLSSAGTSLSAAGTSLSSMGAITPSSAPTHVQVDWRGYNLAADPFRVARGGLPEPGSYAEMLRQLNGPGPSALITNPYLDAPWAANHRDLAQLLYGPLWSDRPYQIQHDPTGALGRGFGGQEVASLFDSDLDVLLRQLGGEFDYLRLLLASDRGGLDRLLAQPFNVLLTWGPNAFDLDLHMTGPLDVPGQRFHIYYAARGQLEGQPFAQLIRDCICASGSEVILTSALNTQGGVYRVSVYNFGNSSATSTNLADQSQAVLQIVRGGVAVPLGNGTTIQGGTTLLTVTPPAGQPGNTWVAAEIDPRRGSITSPNVIVQSQGSGNVQ